MKNMSFTFENAKQLRFCYKCQHDSHCIDSLTLSLSLHGFCESFGVALHERIMQRRRTPLIRAAARGHTECVRLLLEAGADKDAANDVREYI